MSERGFIRGALAGLALAIALIGISSIAQFGLFGGVETPSAITFSSTTAVASTTTAVQHAAVTTSTQTTITSNASSPQLIPAQAWASSNALNSLVAGVGISKPDQVSVIRAFSPLILALALALIVYLILRKERNP